MKIPSGEGVGMVNSPLVTQVNYNSYHVWQSHSFATRSPLVCHLFATRSPLVCHSFATRGKLKLPFVTHGKFIIPTPPPEGIEAISDLVRKPFLSLHLVSVDDILVLMCLANFFFYHLNEPLLMKT